MAKRRKTKFITDFERTRRIEVLMAAKDPSWTWYRLAKEMNRSLSSVQRALNTRKSGEYQASLGMIMSCAKALGVSAGFLIDRKLQK